MSNFQTGLNLTSDSYTGSAIYVIDTTKSNTWLQSVEFTSTSANPAYTSLSAKLAVSNYSCLFSNYMYITSLQSLPSFNLSGRYVKLVFEFTRSTLQTISPKLVQFDLNVKYNDLQYVNRDIFKIKTDIFGIHYGLLKEDNKMDMYNKKLQDGEMVIRTLDNKINPLNVVLESNFQTYLTYNTIYPNLYNQMLSGIKDFELIYDTLMFITEDYVVFEKISFDYNTNTISTEPTNFYVINLSANNYTYGDIWLFEDKKDILIFLSEEKYLNAVKIHEPIVFNLNLNDGVFKNVELLDENNEISQLTCLNLDYIENPVVTFNKLNKTFNMSYIFADTLSGVNIASFDLLYSGTKLSIDNINVITPVDYN